MPAAPVIKTQMQKAPGTAASMDRAPTATAEASPEPVKMKHVPRQGASSAKQGGLARPSEELEPSQGQEGSDGSMRFTPAQQAVAAALMVVMNCAMRNDREDTLAVPFAFLTLKFNNPSIMPFLEMLLEDRPLEGFIVQELPTFKQLEQRASVQVLRSLTKLASQCAAAECQPLEVFTRSMQCMARMADLDCRDVDLGAYDWQRRREEQYMPFAPSVSQAHVEDLQKQGVQESLAELAVSFWQVINAYNGDKEAALWLQSDLKHMLPGRIQRSTHLSQPWLPACCLQNFYDAAGCSTWLLSALMPK